MDEQITQYTEVTDFIKPITEARYPQVSEKSEIENLLGQTISDVILNRINSWNIPSKSEEQEVTGTLGVKTPVGKIMQAGAALRGIHLKSERVYTESHQEEQVPGIQTLKLHLIIEASPTILAFTKYQDRALDILSAFIELHKSKIESLSSVLKIGKIDKDMQILVLTKNGVYSYDTGHTLSPSDAVSEYKNSLVASIEKSNSNKPKLIELSKRDLIRKILEQSMSNKATGTMNLHILAGEEDTYLLQQLLRSINIKKSLSPEEEVDLIYIPVNEENVAVRDITALNAQTKNE